MEATTRDEFSLVPTNRDDLDRIPAHLESAQGLPSELASRFTEVDWQKARGAEAEMIFARDRASNQSVAIKLFRKGIDPKVEVMELLQTMDKRYVIHQLEFGLAGEQSFQIMERAEGSLADLLKGGSLSVDVLFDVIGQTAECLCYLHTQPTPIVHRDIKPDNILMLTRQPLRLVLTDFSFASQLDSFSRVATTTHRTEAYAAPEASVGDISVAADWWSLGMVVVEAATGMNPFKGLDSLTIAKHYLNRVPVPLEGVQDQRLTLLCKGLLCYNQKNRWGIDQVRRWLQGDASLKAPGDEAQRSNTPFVVAGVKCWTRNQLLLAFAENWEDGIREFVRRTALQQWLLDAKDYEAYSAYAKLYDNRTLPEEVKMTYWLAMLLPENPIIIEGIIFHRELFVTLLKKIAGTSNRLQSVFQPAFGPQLAEIANCDWLRDVYLVWKQGSEEAAAYDEELHKDAPSLNRLNLNYPDELLWVLLDPEAIAPIRRALKEASRREELRACSWFPNANAIERLTESRCWVLNKHLAKAEQIGNAAIAESRHKRLRALENAQNLLLFPLWIYAVLCLLMLPFAFGFIGDPAQHQSALLVGVVCEIGLISAVPVTALFLTYRAFLERKRVLAIMMLLPVGILEWFYGIRGLVPHARISMIPGPESSAFLPSSSIMLPTLLSYLAACIMLTILIKCHFKATVPAPPLPIQKVITWVLSLTIVEAVLLITFAMPVLQLYQQLSAPVKLSTLNDHMKDILKRGANDYVQRHDEYDALVATVVVAAQSCSNEFDASTAQQRSTRHVPQTNNVLRQCSVSHDAPPGDQLDFSYGLKLRDQHWWNSNSKEVHVKVQSNQTLEQSSWSLPIYFRKIWLGDLLLDSDINMGEASQ